MYWRSVRWKTCRKLVDLSEDLCIFYHHRINHNHSRVLPSPLPFPPVLGLVLKYWNEPQFPDLDFTCIIPLRHSYPRPIPPFPKCSPLLHPKFWTLFSPPPPVIFAIVGFSCPTFSGALELSFSTLTVFLASATLKWNTLSKELSGSSPFQHVGAELLLFQVGKRVRELLTGVNKHHEGPGLILNSTRKTTGTDI